MTRSRRRSAFWLSALLPVLLTSACATIRTIPGTTVSDTKQNREIWTSASAIATRLEDRDGSQLLAMAHPQYYEDSGTPKGDDDYGYDGLRDVLSKRLAAVRAIRYNIEYRKIDVSGSHANVDIRYDASFQLATEMGDRWERKQNDKRLELENDGNRWLFIAGM